MTEVQNAEVQKLKATVFDILERIELHQLEIQKLDEVRKQVITKLNEIRKAIADDLAGPSDEKSKQAPQGDIEINHVPEEGEETQEDSSTE